MIDIYVNEIRQALRRQCYFPALALALALPDICGMAEYPDLLVSDRYMAWYDKYLGRAMSGGSGGAPYLSGEVVYNLRCTYLHQGSPNVQRDKVREEANQVDKFILLLGDGTEVHEMTMTGRTEKETFKLILVDVTYLCGSICDAALWYYARSREKFRFDFDVLPQADFRRSGGFSGLAASLTAGNRTPSPVPAGPDKAKKDSKAPEAKSADAKAVKTPDAKAAKAPDAKAAKASKTATAPQAKTEHQLRCYFGQSFKEKKYRERREDILSAVLSAKSRQELNNGLTKLFPGEDVKIILQRFKEQIKNLPGK